MDDPFEYYFLKKLRDLQQTSTVDQYYSRFDFLSMFVLFEYPWICTQYFLSTFILGLKQEIKAYVLQFHPTNVVDAYDLACIYQYSHCSRSYSANSSSTRMPPQYITEQISVSDVLSRKEEEKSHILNIAAPLEVQCGDVLSSQIQKKISGVLLNESLMPCEGSAPVQRNGIAVNVVTEKLRPSAVVHAIPDSGIDDPSVAGDCTTPVYALVSSCDNEQIQDTRRGAHSSHFTHSSLENDPPMEQCVLVKVLNSVVIEMVLCNTQGVVEHTEELENSWPYTGSPERVTAAIAHIESVLESGMVNVTLSLVLSQENLHCILCTLVFLGFNGGPYFVHQYFLQDSAGMVHGTADFSEAFDPPLLIDTDSEYVVWTKYFANRKGTDTDFSKSIMVVCVLCVAKSKKNCYAQVLVFLLLPVMVAIDWIKALSGLAWGYSTSIQPCILANFCGAVLWVIFPWARCTVWNSSFTLKEEVRCTVQSFWPSLVEASFSLAHLKEYLIEAEQTSPGASCTTTLKSYAQVEHISVQDSSETTLVPDFIQTHLGHNEVEAVSATLDPSLSHREEHTEFAESGAEQGDSKNPDEVIVNIARQNNRNTSSDIPLSSLRPTRSSAIGICLGSSIVTDDGKIYSSYNGTNLIDSSSSPLPCVPSADRVLPSSDDVNVNAHEIAELPTQSVPVIDRKRPSSGMLCAGIRSLIAESVICVVQSDAIRDSNVPDPINVVEPIHQTSLAKSHSELLLMSFSPNSYVATCNVLTADTSLCDSKGSSIQWENSSPTHCDGGVVIVVVGTLIPLALGNATVVSLQPNTTASKSSYRQAVLDPAMEGCELFGRAINSSNMVSHLYHGIVVPKSENAVMMCIMRFDPGIATLFPFDSGIATLFPLDCYSPRSFCHPILYQFFLEDLVWIQSLFSSFFLEPLISYHSVATRWSTLGDLNNNAGQLCLHAGGVAVYGSSNNPIPIANTCYAMGVTMVQSNLWSF